MPAKDAIPAKVGILDDDTVLTVPNYLGTQVGNEDLVLLQPSSRSSLSAMERARQKDGTGGCAQADRLGLASQLGHWKLAGCARGGTGWASVGTCGTSPGLAIPAITYFAHPWKARPN